jgi:hypothetical protein
MPDLRPDHPLSTAALDENAVERIVTIPDPLERNAAITLGYHALSESIAEIIGRDHLNWFSFGQWASAEARRSISGEAVPLGFRHLLGSTVTKAIADGNGTIFGDVAPPFIRFVEAMAPVAGPRVAPGSVRPLDAQAVRSTLDELLTHPGLRASADMRRAFTALADALLVQGSPDGLTPAGTRRRAQRILVANASIGAHEQRVADPFVKAAIPGKWIVAIAATAHMHIRIPEGNLTLDRDVPPPPYLGGKPFPDDLMTLEDPDALELASRFHQDAKSARHSGAPDWESYEERMGFIFTLLRAHQGDPALFDLPPDIPGG